MQGKFTTELRMALHTLIKTVELSKLEMDILDDYSTRCAENDSRN